MSLSDPATTKPVQTAYQRWELASLEEGSQPRSAVTRAPNDKTVQEVLQAREEGRLAGFQKGLKEGFTQGLNEGRAQAQIEHTKLQETFASTLASLVGELQSQASEQQAALAQQLLHLSLDMSKALVKQALTVQPELILPLIQQALDELPSLKEPGILRLHPQDLNLASPWLDAELRTLGWRCVPDEKLERGGCQIETASKGIDASLPTRWQRLQKSLGQIPSPWSEA
jgi:flagellar assembly protein FliH